MLNESKFLELDNRQQESGLTVKDFCANEGIKESTFYYWRKKRQDKGKPKDFIPLIVKPNHTPSLPGQQKNGYPAIDHTTNDNPSFLELVYPNGTKLRLNNDIDLSHLRTLIHLYD